MSQISPPFRIALLAMLAVCARGSPCSSRRPRPATPRDDRARCDRPRERRQGRQGCGEGERRRERQGPERDRGHRRADRHVGRRQGEARATHAAVAGKTAATAKAAPAKKAPAKKAAAADASAPLLTALGEKKAVVLVFYNAKGSDDRAVRAAADRVSHRHGRVIVKSVPVGRLGRYAPITKGVAVAQTPTVMVLAPGNTARTIVGFTTQSEIDQLVGDALTAKAGK